jgi:hypothetical protein
MTPEDKVRAIKSRHSAELLSLPGVSGVGVAKGKAGDLVIAIHLDAEDPQREALLPKEIEGVPVEIIHSGPFRKF